MRTLADKTAAFRALHERPGTFLIPNPWDAGSAKLLAYFGFEALATTSLGLANMLGRADSAVSLDEILANCREIAAAIDLPVNADLEKCGADEPDAAAQAIRRAAEAGMAGGSIEDATGDRSNPIYDFSLAVERVHAAAEMARALPDPFVLTTAPRISSRGGAISTIRSGGCRPSRKPVRTCSMRRRCGILPRSAPWCRRSESPST